MYIAGMQTSHLSAKFAVLKTKLTTCVIRGDPLRKHLGGPWSHGVLVAPANSERTERRRSILSGGTTSGRTPVELSLPCSSNACARS